VRGILIIFAIQNLGFSAVPVLQVIYVDRVLGLPPSAIGYMMSAFAIGMLVGGAALAVFGKRVSYVRSIVVGSIGFSVFFIAMALATSLPAVFAILAGMGVCEAALSVAVPTLLQETVPDALRGRVFSVQNVVLVTMMVLGMGLAGAAADLMSVQTVFLIGGLLALAGGLAGPFVLREPVPVASAEIETERR
jgi:DHA3 family macrolide efflux protein-like MFS transporter